MKSPRLTLSSAILVNLNIMLGSGIFINTFVLAMGAGLYGSFVYGLVGLLLLPLIFSIAALMEHLHGGTFYEFGSVIHPFVGFLASWCYFIAKLASSTLAIHIFNTLISVALPQFSTTSILILDALVICIFLVANMMNMKIGKSIQYAFIVLKSIPLLCIIIAAFLYGQFQAISLAEIPFSHVIASVPFVLFAFSGFEASASLSRSLENPRRDGPLAILISFFCVLIVSALFQACFFSLIAPYVSSIHSFKDGYDVLVRQLPFEHTAKGIINSLLIIGIGISALGAGYGIMFSNAWNLYALALHNTIPGAILFTRLNSFGIPWVCYCTEAIIMLVYLWLTKGVQIPLQQISALGSAIAYTISILAFLFITLQDQTKSLFAAILATGSCFVLLASSMNNGISFGFYGYAIYACFIMLGIVLYSIQSTYFQRHKRQH
jgi:amino acid transporter